MTLLVEKTLNVAATARLMIDVLGPVRIAWDDLPLTFAYEKVQALLVYLAIEADRPHRRTALANLFWPDQDATAARHNLSQALFNLRRAVLDQLDTPLLLATRDSVRLNPAYTLWVDVVAFRNLAASTSSNTARLEQAIALYCGEFLEAFSISDSAGFDEWVQINREQLRTQACDVLRRLTDPQTGLGDSARVCDHARRWVMLDPLDEAAHRRLIRAFANSGQRTQALVQFEHCCRVLRAELGIEPEPATIALYEEVKRQIPSTVLTQARPLRAALPQPTTRLIGRDADLAALAILLADSTSRLITITGPGGVGKTRLALAGAAASAFADADCVCCVQLAMVREPALVLAALAQALDVPQNSARPLDELVYVALARQHMLLLLDNCEHLLPDLASFVAELLAEAPHLTILATSRVALHISHERRYQLRPLSVPDAHQTDTNPGSSAVALFIERAQAVRPTIELDIAAIAAICRRLDGLPLAIELAATRLRLLSLDDLLARLEQPLPLLNGGPRDLPERQQTLHATIDWSYQLLDPDQQALMRRLAVFAGGWTVAAAELVCADPSEQEPQIRVLDGLTTLFDASLISESANSAASLTREDRHRRNLERGMLCG